MKKATLGLVALAAVLLFVAQFIGTLERLHDLPNSWSASEKWIESAECARTTGKLLVGCKNDGTIVPYSELSNADDVGHALFLGMYSIVTGKTLILEHGALLNVVVNFTGVALIAAIILGAGQFWSSVVVLIGGGTIASSYVGIAPHSALPGITCFAMAFPLSLLVFPSSRWWTRIAWLVAGAAALAGATLLRQSLGMMGTFAGLVAVAVAISYAQNNRQRLQILITALPLLFAASMATTVTLALRDAAWNVTAGNLVDRHGIQHNLLLGLGVIENSFGVRWDDAYGLEAARLVDPNIGYVSQDYYRILGQEYLRMVLSDPIEVVRIYVAKALMFLFKPLGSNFWATFPVFMAIVFVLLFYVVTRRIHRSVSGDYIFIVSGLFVIMHLGQAILIHPDMQYGSPTGMLLMIALASTFSVFPPSDVPKSTLQQARTMAHGQ